MSRLDDLIQNLCPNGVPFKRLDDCCTLAKGSTPIQKAVPGEYPLVVTTSERKSANTYQFDKPTVCVPLVSSRGHGVASLNQVYYQEGKFALGNILCGVTPNEDSGLTAKFLHCYLNQKKDTLIVPLMKGGANVSLTVNSLKTVIVPIPPIEVQNEILRLIQIFEDLRLSLQAELTARKAQCEYYRNQLIHKNETPCVELSDCCKFQNGFAFKSGKFRDTGYPILRITNITDGRIDDSSIVYFSMDDYNTDFTNYMVKRGDIVVAMSGATTGKIGCNYTDNVYFLNQRVGLFRPNEDILDKRYLYHWLQSISQQILEISSGTGAQPNLSSQKMMTMKIPLPTITEQKRIAASLDKFERLWADVNWGIPAEINARQKQYEYYRNKLLSFMEISV